MGRQVISTLDTFGGRRLKNKIGSIKTPKTRSKLSLVRLETTSEPKIDPIIIGINTGIARDKPEIPPRLYPATDAMFWTATPIRLVPLATSPGRSPKIVNRATVSNEPPPAIAFTMPAIRPALTITIA
jgi:hypothetical protein